MKITSLAALNSVGLQNPAQKALYAACLLFSGTNTSPQIQITPAVLATPTTPAIPAVIAPAVIPLINYSGTVRIEDQADTIHIQAALPYTANLIGKGIQLTDKSILPITQPNLDLGSWVGDKASNQPGTDTVFPQSVEQYLYLQATTINNGYSDQELALLPQPVFNKGNLNDSRRTPVIVINLYLPKNRNISSYLGSVAMSSVTQTFSN